MKLKFIEEGHLYLNVDPEDDFRWISATTLIGQFKEPFDELKVAERCSKKTEGKYAGRTVDDILEAWRNERNRSTSMGSWFHNQREDDVLQFNTITREGRVLPIINPHVKNGVKISPDQKLQEGVYPEHFVYLRSGSICGQADRIEVVDHRLDVYDYKTNKEIKERGHEFWDGRRKMMLGPLRHLEDCELTHYTLQLSLYMFITLKYNYNLVPGKIELVHIEFEQEGIDEWEFPIYAKDAKGDPIVKAVNRIQVPYLKKEVIMMLKWLKQNKERILHEKDEHTTN